MTVRKILVSENLPRLRRHFEDCRTNARRKVASLRKQVIKAEQELATAEDGIRLCDRVYEVGK